jgi:hypothetical protein
MRGGVCWSFSRPASKAAGRPHELRILRIRGRGVDRQKAHLHNSSLLAVSAGVISSGPKPYLARMARCHDDPAP